MIISHSLKFIFVKTRKTASTSMELALACMCSDEDVITTLGVDEDELRLEYAGRKPQNYFFPYSKYTVKEWGRLCLKGKRAPFLPHMPAKDVRRIVGEAI